MYRRAFAELKSGETASNRIYGQSIYQGYKADDLGVHIIIDANHYEYSPNRTSSRLTA